MNSQTNVNTQANVGIQAQPATGNGHPADASPARGNDAVAAQPRQEQRPASGSEAVVRPPVDIYETGDGITLQADMPGVSKDRLNLRIEGNSLLVEGSIGISPPEHMTPLHAEVRSTVYRRSFHLSNELEAGKIEANLKDGLLTVHIPKRAELRPRRIEVKG